MDVKIKICGLRRKEDILTANRLRPDYVGFVFAPGSPRCVSREEAIQLRQLLDPGIRAVGVFVNENIRTVAGLLADGIIQVAQLHGQENENYILSLQRMTGRHLIKAFRVENSADVGRAAASNADCILLDHGAGGTGESFDWDLVQGLTRPYFLAGGLNADNVQEALRQTRPWGVDVSSGVETDGVKDAQKMEQFVRCVRELQRG